MSGLVYEEKKSHFCKIFVCLLFLGNIVYSQMLPLPGVDFMWVCPFNLLGRNLSRGISMSLEFQSCASC